MPRPCRTPTPASTYHGLVRRAGGATKWPASTPTLPNLPVLARTPGMSSPVPTRTGSSSAAVLQTATRIAPQDSGVLGPPDPSPPTVRSAQPPTGDHVPPPSPEY